MLTQVSAPQMTVAYKPELAEYHMAKSAETPESRKARQLATVERCAGQLTAALEALKANG